MPPRAIRGAAGASSDRHRDVLLQLEGLQGLDAGALVRDIVKRKLHLFDGYTDVQRPDLVQEVSASVKRAWATYNPAKSKPSTFICTVAYRRLYTLSRDLSRRAKRDATANDQAAERLRESLRPEMHNEADTDNDVIDWLGSVYRTARHNLPRTGVPLYAVRGRHSYPNRAQRTALLLLKRRLKLTVRGMVLLLRAKPELLAAVQLDRAPSHMAVQRLEKSVTHIGRHYGAVRPRKPGTGGSPARGE
jgi:DNA-directed RNA polymerase specialized sigma24 family protein